jgi:hypothetical protein
MKLGKTILIELFLKIHLMKVVNLNMQRKGLLRLILIKYKYFLKILLALILMLLHLIERGFSD